MTKNNNPPAPNMALASVCSGPEICTEGIRLTYAKTNNSKIKTVPNINHCFDDDLFGSIFVSLITELYTLYHFTQCLIVKARLRWPATPIEFVSIVAVDKKNDRCIHRRLLNRLYFSEHYSTTGRPVSRTQHTRITRVFVGIRNIVKIFYVIPNGIKNFYVNISMIYKSRSKMNIVSRSIFFCNKISGVRNFKTVFRVFVNRPLFRRRY